MKKLKKSRVSWPPDPLLCQVKLFSSEDCPAEVASSRKSPVPDLPPGFESNLSDIPRLKWRYPSKFVLSPSWRVGAGQESTERQTQNLRIAKVLEAIYPHRSAIPYRSSVTPDVEGECYDDRKTPIIRLTPIEDEWEAAEKSSQTPLQSDNTMSRQCPLETRPPSSTQGPVHATVSARGADVSLAVSAGLTALTKSKEHQSMIDPDLLIKFLSDPKIIQNLISERIDKPSEAENPPLDTDITPRHDPKHVHNSAVDRTPQPLPMKQTPFTSPEPPRVSPPRYGNGNSHGGSMSVVPCTSVAIETPLLKPAQVCQLAPHSLNLQRPPPVFGGVPVSAGAKPSIRHQPGFSTLPMNPNPVEALPEPNRLVKPQSHSPFSTMSMNVVQASVGHGPGPRPGPGPKPGFQSGFNLNRVEVPIKQELGAPPPVKSVDYFKNLIREHGKDNAETTNEYRLQSRGFNTRAGDGNVVEEGKKQKPCMYFGSKRGCRLGDRCTFMHGDGPKLWGSSHMEAEAPRAKRPKFGT
ncbi:PREDICTED: zinc finger CCCH domain-containing protein 45 [Tarenaya hassleriana]|uniref:zinc finger CCCH domain-containing protein 45 n=1 Tax=Tarenaya hassleriana TaxID=28532 RepID=UPI00053C3704|nr:PREDICTED: zinc finger CCCH domain-containing protein 45 [Tarenaya hassleriana]